MRKTLKDRLIQFGYKIQRAWDTVVYQWFYPFLPAYLYDGASWAIFIGLFVIAVLVIG